MLDASKAFDRVNLLTLFKKLYDKGLCPLYLRLLMILYKEQKMRVRWNTNVSEIFSVSNGVKQGGVLSPLLFSLYLDDLISQLRDLGIGCHMNGLFTGAFIYADDITILAPSCYALKSMLRVCEEYALSHDILFNSLKTKCMFFNRSSLLLKPPPLYFLKTRIDFVKECVLLGILISSDLSDKNVLHAVHKFNRKSNELRYDFKLLSCDVKSRLFTSYCLDAYGSQIWSFDSNTVQPFYVAWRKMVRLLWNLPNKTHCNLLPCINDTLPIDISLEKRCIKFLWTSLNSSNDVVKLITLSSIKTDRSVLGDNYRYLSHKYNIKSIQWFDSYNIVNHCIKNYIALHVNYPQDAYVIRDLCFYRDYGDPFVLTSTDIVQLIEYLCTI